VAHSAKDGTAVFFFPSQRRAALDLYPESAANLSPGMVLNRSTKTLHVDPAF
jgi:hypothetical protein